MVLSFLLACRLRLGCEKPDFTARIEVFTFMMVLPLLLFDGFGKVVAGVLVHSMDTLLDIS